MKPSKAERRRCKARNFGPVTRTDLKPGHRTARGIVQVPGKLRLG